MELLNSEVVLGGYRNYASIAYWKYLSGSLALSRGLNRDDVQAKDERSCARRVQIAEGAHPARGDGSANALWEWMIEARSCGVIAARRHVAPARSLC
jgi:hypothetical protein